LTLPRADESLGIVDRHASESYFVPGEGLLAMSAGGRGGGDAQPAAPFRFSRMGPHGRSHQLGERTTEILGINMAGSGGSTDEGSSVPAGYTYLGQFVAHDLSFDKTGVTLPANVSPAQLLQGTSPSLDLDSLYGAGPQDERSKEFYEPDGERLRTGRTVAAAGHGELAGFDLPRGAGETDEQKRRAVIADERNDDNVAVAQTHAAFIRFHNAVVSSLPESTLRFACAREIVTKHYQWAIRHDFLPLVCDEAVLDDVFANGRRAFEVDVEPTAVPTMPLEFSVAAFRLGHSMVRHMYRWNDVREDVMLEQLFQFAAKGGDLGGNERLPSDMIADFRRLYDFCAAGLTAFEVAQEDLNRAMRIDTRIVGRLGELPSGISGEPGLPPDDVRSNLAFRNLNRARKVELASGPQMADFLRDSCGVELVKLTPGQIVGGTNGTSLHHFSEPRMEELREHAPLWFYILREAERNDGKLTGVGARIVAETFHRAIEGSAASIVRDPGWCPTLGRAGAPFGMVDLLRHAFEDSVRLMAPLAPHDRR
jgi:hypothetical protein